MPAQWTAKLPTLLVGIALWFVALLLAVRGWKLAAILAAVLGVSFFAYSLTIKEWCKTPVAVYGQSSWGPASAWHTGFGKCIEKTWLEF